QIHELGRDSYGIFGHLTSLKPIRRENAPDPWEAEALRSFEQGTDEVSSLEHINGEPYMRYMRPIMTEASCLKCHAAQGYKVGDIRGGLSVAVPMKELLATMKLHNLYDSLGHGFLWAIGLALIGWGSSRLIGKTNSLKENETRYRMLFNSGNDALFVHGVTETGMPGRFIEVNEIACQRLGYSKSELLQMSPADINSPKSFENISEIACRLMQEKSVLFETEHITKDGLTIPVEINAHIFDLNGKSAVLSVARDISQRRHAEAKLQLERNKLKGILDSMPDGVYIASQQYDIEYINPALERDFGPIEGRKCYKYFHDRTEVCPWCKNEEVFAGGSVRWEFTAAKTGKIYDLFDTPIRNEDGSVSKLEFFHDVTARNKAEEEKQMLHSQLLQAQKLESIGRLAGGVAHDFNNLLTVILGYSEMLQGMLQMEDPVREKICFIHEAGDRAAALTHQLLAFSRKQPLELKSVRLNGIIENLARMLTRLIGEDIVLEMKLKSVQYVMADRGQIEQTFMNLAVNARDAMPSGGRLIIETEDTELDAAYMLTDKEIPPGHYVMLSVTDTGEGISRELRDRIFEPFFTTKELGKGTGLGLATVYGIVKQHDGHIRLYSEPGRGTTFKIYFPVATETAEATVTHRPKSFRKGSETILVVDDDLMILGLIKDTLQPLGYRVLQASSGEEAIEISKNTEDPINLLLADVVMPRMNGVALADRLMTVCPDLRVILMSGYPDISEKVQDLLRAGFFFLQKPLTPSSLLQKMKEVIGEEGF
ncbi:MAG: PAS domain S-box protein, partial [Nitrospirota bacterium]|nr:PAS domain S-box protein [Nitrospirota bacterium]